MFILDDETEIALQAFRLAFVRVRHSNNFKDKPISTQMEVALKYVPRFRDYATKLWNETKRLADEIEI